MSKDVLKNLLNGVIMKQTIKKMEMVEHKHIFFVLSVKRITLSEVIYFLQILKIEELCSESLWKSI